MLPTAILVGALMTTTEGAAQSHPAPTAQPRTVYCGTDSILRGGGMINDGWDGPGQNATTLFWHIENYSPDLPVTQQRNAIEDALLTWAGVVQIHFIEIASPNRNRSIDLRFTTGDHCAIENAECGDPDCAFNGTGGVLAHAGFPPGGNSLCGGVLTESFAGNVHFDEAETWEADDFFSARMSLALITAHEVGHSLGLLHDLDTNALHIMRPTFSGSDGLQAPSASDIAHLRSGYAAGVGSITRLEDSGIWTNSAWQGFEAGLPGEPFNTLTEAVNALPPEIDGMTIHVVGGLYPENLTISEPCTITAEISTAFIGTP
jgi:hypothetical protein